MCNRAWLVIALLAMVALPACAPWREPATVVSREKATIEALATRIKQETADIDTVPRPVVEQTLAGPEQPAPNLAPAMNVVESIEVIGQIGGATHAVAISGSLAYVGVGPCLLILNVSDPTDTSIVGQTGVLARHEGGGRDTLGTFRGVAVAGDLAYIADGYSGLRIIDVADPAAPREVGFYVTRGSCEGVAVAGSTIYVADQQGGLLILSLTQTDR
jgi:hypothetical protein